MKYDDFRRELAKAGLTIREFAEIVKDEQKLSFKSVATG
jgi:hypothetical protein